MNKKKRAEELFDKGFSCSQAIFSVFSEELGLSRDQANKIASAFGGGLAGLGETCGAVTGALMVLGLKYGRVNPDDLTAKEKTHELSNLYFQKFMEKHKSLICRNLKVEDRSTPEKIKLAHEICSNYIQDTVIILEEIL